jgi:hypothetical protein
MLMCVLYLLVGPSRQSRHGQAQGLPQAHAHRVQVQEVYVSFSASFGLVDRGLTTQSPTGNQNEEKALASGVRTMNQGIIWSRMMET